jgi:hypothetical protein
VVIQAEQAVQGRGRRILRLFFAAALAAAALSAAAAYRFRVPGNRCVVTVNSDASVTVSYAISFANEGQPIDIVDVGLPDDNYSEVAADLDGVPLKDIRPSTEVAHGVEVHLEDRAIPAGSTATLHLTARMADRVFPDRDDRNYASLEFTTTWYGSQYTDGTTHLVCEFVLPEGVGPDEPRYHGTPFTSARVENGRVVYSWEMPDASPSEGYTFGASFPSRVMSRMAEEPKGPGPISLVFTGLLHFIGASVPCFFFTLFIAIVILAGITQRRRRMQYLPPTVGIEGVDVRRGLTVPEVAVLMQEKVDKVMALILFGMLRKGQLEVVGRSPLRLKVVAGAKPEFSYEQEFAKAVQDDGKLSESEAAKVLVDLIKRVQDKMKGFNRAKSIAYYREIMRKAWEQVGKDDYSQAFEWMLLDKDFDRTAAQRFGTTPVPVPVWWFPMTVGHPSGQGAGLPGSVPSPVSAANSIVSGLESFGHDLVNSVPGLATKVTAATNPVPVSSGGGHSGGGCACACACAGCACACAGGGR